MNTMNIIEKLAFLGYTPEEVTANTYIYEDEDGLCGIEKRDRHSEPSDLINGGEYVIASYYVNEARNELREFLSVK